MLIARAKLKLKKLIMISKFYIYSIIMIPPWKRWAPTYIVSHGKRQIRYEIHVATSSNMLIYLWSNVLSLMWLAITLSSSSKYLMFRLTTMLHLLKKEVKAIIALLGEQNTSTGKLFNTQSQSSLSAYLYHWLQARTYVKFNCLEKNGGNSFYLILTTN